MCIRDSAWHEAVPPWIRRFQAAHVGRGGQDRALDRGLLPALEDDPAAQRGRHDARAVPGKQEWDVVVVDALHVGGDLRLLEMAHRVVAARLEVVLRDPRWVLAGDPVVAVADDHRWRGDGPVAIRIGDALTGPLEAARRACLLYTSPSPRDR